MVFSDRRLLCGDCGLEFVFSVAEQQRQASSGFRHEPRRCPDCRPSRRPAESARVLPRSRRGVGLIGTRTLFPAVCAVCGQNTRLPFKPRGDRPLYCVDCFGRRRG
jgi:CxxC-x17-CxxC domain-containing protein